MIVEQLTLNSPETKNQMLVASCKSVVNELLVCRTKQPNSRGRLHVEGVIHQRPVTNKSCVPRANNSEWPLCKSYLFDNSKNQCCGDTQQGQAPCQVPYIHLSPLHSQIQLQEVSAILKSIFQVRSLRRIQVVSMYIINCFTTFQNSVSQTICVKGPVFPQFVIDKYFCKIR